MPLFIPHLMLDFLIMRGSAVCNWRRNPVITCSRDGSIKRNKVTSTTPGFLFYDYPPKP